MFAYIRSAMRQQTLLWSAGPAQPRIAGRSVHVWLADLAAVSETVLELLSEQERGRARLLSQERARRWARGRGLLRRLLGDYLQLEPRSLQLTAGAHGKPRLAAPADQRISFNLSHCGDLALYAFAAGSPVGVDVEVQRAGRRDRIGVARRAFGPGAADRLLPLSPVEREREFLRAWTRHEARLKCLGLGIGAGASSPRPAGDPWVAELALGPGAAGAVAVQGQPAELRRWLLDARRPITAA